VCVRPFTMEVGDRDTGELRYVPVPCGSTVESVCLPCAKKAKALRQVQCREGWHLTEEPDFTSRPPTEDQPELMTFRGTRPGCCGARSSPTTRRCHLGRI
jgi:hypothetical protein